MFETEIDDFEVNCSGTFIPGKRPKTSIFFDAPHPGEPARLEDFKVHRKSDGLDITKEMAIILTKKEFRKLEEKYVDYCEELIMEDEESA